MPTSRPSKRFLVFGLVAALLIPSLVNEVEAATTPSTKKSTAASKRPKPTKTPKPPKLPRCTVKRLTTKVRASNGVAYVCTRSSTGARVWIAEAGVVAVVTTSPPPPVTTGPTIAPTPEPTPTAAPSTASATTLPTAPSTAPPTTPPAEATKPPATFPTSTLQPSTTTTIPKVGPGTVALSVRGLAGTVAEFDLICNKPGYAFAKNFQIAVGNTARAVDIKAPVLCQITNLRESRGAVAANLVSATDSSAPANDLTVSVLPDPSPPASFMIQVGPRDSPIGGGPLVIK